MVTTMFLFGLEMLSVFFLNLHFLLKAANRFASPVYHISNWQTTTRKRGDVKTEGAHTDVQKKKGV
jgi:hypothetical protein